MKKLFLSMACLMIFSTLSFGQDEMDPGMKAWMDYMTPGETHKMLADAAGKWDTKATFWMAPGTDPTVSVGTTTVEMMLGGRYQKATTHSEMMGMSFEGISITAYDNATKEFNNLWIDNMGTGMMTGKGKYDETTKKIVFKGTYVDPMTGNEEPFMETYQVIDNDNHLFEMFTYPGGQEFKSMIVEYTRKSEM
ncbi:MAG: hypothetical protein A2057_10430 [Ignavibacteria bacterium GWA2_35_9]|nr:MAG: hypothetical protein A2057_10430 [Ignavibacteria bacterium GWA2_35_9]